MAFFTSLLGSTGCPCSLLPFFSPDSHPSESWALFHFSTRNYWKLYSTIMRIFTCPARDSFANSIGFPGVGKLTDSVTYSPFSLKGLLCQTTPARVCILLCGIGPGSPERRKNSPPTFKVTDSFPLTRLLMPGLVCLFSLSSGNCSPCSLQYIPIQSIAYEGTR